MKHALTLNGTAVEIEAEPFDRLIDHLADHGLTGPRKSCGIGRCGACMVLLDGQPANACLLPMARVAGRRIVTAEGLDATAETVIDSLARHGAVQCGYCTPGMLVGLTAGLADPERPGASEMRARMTGNLCRCTGYAGLNRVIDELFD